MQQEQQQRIMGYFIEEAKDHLNTIEQGLLNLQSTMEDTEMLQEVFRAAHSVKGGAAMLGLTSIQRTSHRLEDCIKVLQESSVKVDRQLESLFLQVFDTLGSLVEQLQGPLGLTDETAGVIMSEAEPVFEELNTHLEQLVKQAEGSPAIAAEAVRATATHDASDALRTHRTFAPTSLGSDSGSGAVPEEPAVASIGRSTNSMESGTHNPLATTALPVAFKRTVLVQLREMLQLFKQPDSPEHREALQENCRTLLRLGDQFDLPGWNELIEIAHNALARPQNSYRQLATLVIKEIKQAQELAVAGRSVEIAPSEQLKALVPISPTSEPGQPSAIQEEDFDLLFDPNSNSTSTTPDTTGATDSADLAFETDLFNSPDTYIQDDSSEEFNGQDFGQDGLETESGFYHNSISHPQFRSGSIPAAPIDPEVGMAELNSLADIFEGQTPDLDQTWQEEEIISLDNGEFPSERDNVLQVDDQSDFEDLLSDSDDSATPTLETSEDDLMGWLGNDSTEELAFNSQESADSLFDEFQPETTSSLTDDFSDLLFEAAETPSADDLTNLFGDSFFEEDEALAAPSTNWELQNEAIAEFQQPDDDLFTMPAETAPNEVEVNRTQRAGAPADADIADIFSDGEDIASEELTWNEEGSPLVFEEASFLELDGFSSEAGWADEEIDRSDSGLGDLLGISDRDTTSEGEQALELEDFATLSSMGEDAIAFPDLTDSDMSEAQSLEVPAAQDDLAFSLDDAASELSFGELTFDDSPNDNAAAELINFEELTFDDSPNDNAASELSFEELTFDDSPNDNAASELSFDELTFDDSPSDNAAAELNFEELTFDDSPSDNAAAELNFDELTFDDSTDAFDLAQSEAFDFDELEVDNTATPTNLQPSELDFDLEETSASSPFNVELESEGGMDNLFEDEVLPSVEAYRSPTFRSLEELENLLDSQPPAPESEALAFEEFSLDSPEQPESLFELESFNDVFDTELDATDTASVDRALEFEEFSLQDEGLGEDLFGDRATELEPTADFSESLFDEDESLFELESPTLAAEREIGSAIPTSEAATDDLDALLGRKTPEETDSLDAIAADTSELNFAEDALLGEAFSPEGDFALEGEEALAAQAALFDWEASEGNDSEQLTPQATEDMAVDLNSTSSELETLLSQEAPTDVEALELSEENLFAEPELASHSELESAAWAGEEIVLDWEATDTLDAENLDDFFSMPADEASAIDNWDEVLTAPQDSDELGDATVNLLAEEWNWATPEEETVAALSLEDEAAAGVAPVDSGASEWEGLNELLGEEPEETAVTYDFSSTAAGAADQFLASELDDSEQEAALASAGLEFEDLEAMLSEATTLEGGQYDGFADLEAMLSEQSAPSAALASSGDTLAFEDLEALLEEPTPAAASATPTAAKTSAQKANTADDEFGDLENLLKQFEEKIGGPPSTTVDQRQARPSIRPRTVKVFEQTMRVPVKHLDSLSNLVGELVVNRNSLEQDQEQLRQFLDNLSHQVLALSDVGARMQDLYERSLLESSLLASRRSISESEYSESSNAPGFDPLEMDRFTGFHLLSQEMIELIVRVRESASDIELLVDGTDQVARMLRQVTTQLQEGLTRARMVPFAQNADRLLRAVREISLKLRKQAELHVEGRETLIDKMILENLYDPMTHLVNNALTHGIESPEVRRAAGKSPVGQITLKAFHQGNQTVISIADDGAGIDAERVRAKAIEQKLIDAEEAKKLTPIDLYDFLFHPGFSTKDKADDFCGRGVGMDVVRTCLSEIRGTIHIDSAPGKGTTFTIRLPLTLSICKALCCLSDRARIAFPMDGVEDMLDVSSDRIQMNSDDQTCIQWRDSLLPFQPLTELLTYNRQISRGTVYGGKREDDSISIVVLRSAGNFLAVQVDQVLGEQEIVIKQLEGPAPKPVGIAGATVLGDGRIMPIADVLELIDLAMGRIRKDGGVTIWPRDDIQEQIPDEEVPETKPEPMVLIVDDSITVRELLSMTFSKAGYRVEQARDGQEAWDKLRSGLPCDIVFCDIEMPRMDGLELLSRLQKDDKLRELPIAMLTSRGADRHRQMASQLGARGYFTKPYLEEVLLDAAQRMIRGEVLFSSGTNV